MGGKSSKADGNTPGRSVSPKPSTTTSVEVFQSSAKREDKVTVVRASVDPSKSSATPTPTKVPSSSPSTKPPSASPSSKGSVDSSSDFVSSSASPNIPATADFQHVTTVLHQARKDFNNEKFRMHNSESTANGTSQPSLNRILFDEAPSVPHSRKQEFNGIGGIPGGIIDDDIDSLAQSLAATLATTPSSSVRASNSSASTLPRANSSSSSRGLGASTPKGPRTIVTTTTTTTTTSVSVSVTKAPIIDQTDEDLMDAILNDVETEEI
eukprot:GILI01008024.1.p1 GENE.GILI01008024.1~~GILI01008024.1.p1  ORF type:complete len:267 (+),score=63.00 GILI01008024.1:170-970(+)